MVLTVEEILEESKQKAKGVSFDEALKASRWLRNIPQCLSSSNTRCFQNSESSITFSSFSRALSWRVHSLKLWELIMPCQWPSAT